MQACFRGWVVRKSLKARKALARSVGDESETADESYLQATIMLMNDLLRDLKPTAFEWTESSTGEVSSVEIPSIFTCALDQRPSCPPAQNQYPHMNAKDELRCSLDGLEAFQHSALKAFGHTTSASTARQSLKEDTVTEFGVEDKEEACSSENARDDDKCDIQLVSNLP